ncbi:hypothetical protein [Peptoniphilus sp. HCN-40583]|uniref:hypothetical protein n=1 Tax=Peptoniphilus sp. HCN-40583 TaxID=3134662 RepID=UPI0030EC149D
MYKVRMKNIDDPEEVLIKALQSIQADRKGGEIQDDYLKYLADYADAIYSKVTDAMIKDILDVMFETDNTKKSIRSVRIDLNDIRENL